MDDMQGFDDGLTDAFGGFSQFDSRNDGTDDAGMEVAEQSVEGRGALVDKGAGREGRRRECEMVSQETEIMDMFMDEVFERVKQPRRESKSRVSKVDHPKLEEKEPISKLLISSELTQSCDEAGLEINDDLNEVQIVEKEKRMNFEEKDKVSLTKEPPKKFCPPFIGSSVKTNIAKPSFTKLNETEKAPEPILDKKQTPNPTEINTVKLKKFIVTPMPIIEAAIPDSSFGSKINSILRPGSIRLPTPQLSTIQPLKPKDQPAIKSNTPAVSLAFQFNAQRPALEKPNVETPTSKAPHLPPTLDLQKQVKLNPAPSPPLLSAKPPEYPLPKHASFPSLQSSFSLAPLQQPSLPKPALSHPTFKPQPAPVTSAPAQQPQPPATFSARLSKTVPASNLNNLQQKTDFGSIKCQGSSARLEDAGLREHRSGKLFLKDREKELHLGYQKLREELLRVQETHLKCSYIVSRVNSMVGYMKKRVRQTDREVSHFIGQS